MGPSQAKPAYHHGDLRATLVDAALELLEAGEPFSLRAVARRAGVSTAAPYRHFADRASLESALAVRGFRELMTDISRNTDQPRSKEVVIELAVDYVRFALRRPALFRLMFGQECKTDDDERVQAAGALHDFLERVAKEVFPQSDPMAMATAGWSIAHGLAFLHLDGKLTNSSQTIVDDRVRTVLAAVFPSNPDSEVRVSS